MYPSDVTNFPFQMRHLGSETKKLFQIWWLVYKGVNVGCILAADSWHLPEPEVYTRLLAWASAEHNLMVHIF